MNIKRNPSCAVPKCTHNINVEKRHFFRFPKEHNRLNITLYFLNKIYF